MKTQTSEVSVHLPAALQTLLGATCIALAPIFAVLAARADDLAPTVTAFWRTALAAPVLASASFIAGRRKASPNGRLAWQHVLWLCLPGLCFAVDLASWHTAMDHIAAGLATVLGNLSVVIVPVMAWLVLAEPYDRRRIGPTGLAIAGAALVCIPPDASIVSSLGVRGGDYLLGNALAGGTAFAYAAYQVSIKKARQFAGTLSVMWISSTTTAALLLLACLALGERIVPRNLEALAHLAGLALISHCLGQGLIARSLGTLPAHAVALLLLWQPACSALLGVWLLGQQMSGLQGLGSVIVLSGLAWATLTPRLTARRRSGEPRC